MSDFEDLDYYELLGVSRTATPEEIKRAYRQEISKYHPDRFANATPTQQEYASRRSQRLTEAYGVLSDMSARTAYNRGQPARRGVPARRAPPPPAQPRDHQAELYEQARQHMDAGRFLQAIGALRQLQQLNPFYKDSADLLAKAEAQLHARQQPAHGERSIRRPLLIAGGLFGGAAVVAIVALAVDINRNPGGTIGVASGVATTALVLSTTAPQIATAMPTTPPAPTSIPVAPTAPPTQLPTEPPSPVPNKPPSPLPTEPPSPPAAPATPEPTVPATAQPPVIAETGTLLFADNFSGGGWADSGGAGWRVGYARGLYRIAVNAGYGTIWSFRTAPGDDHSLGADVRVASGEGGLLLHFVDGGNYLSFSVNPNQTSYRLEQHRGGNVTALVGGQSEAIQAGPEAVNRLVARLRGDHIQLLINGQPIAELDAPDAPTSSRFGLLGIGGDTDAEVFFDNLQLRAIED